MLAPVVIFAYNRPWHLQQTVEALQRNPLAAQSILWVFSDFAKTSQEIEKVKQVRKYIRSLNGFAELHIVEREKNWGLANSIITGVSEVLTLYGKAIVLEDDMICTTNFLQFMNDCLEKYADRSDIFSISGYSFPITIPKSYTKDVYLGLRASSWGWATWQDRWRKVDWDVKDFDEFIRNESWQKQFNAGGADLTAMLIRQQRKQIDSWAVRWCYAHFKHQAYCLYPVHSKIQNIGADFSGTHTPKTQKYAVKLQEKPYLLPSELYPEPQILTNLKRFFRPSLWRKLLNWWQLGV
ncbi:MAG: sugar transferase [Microscillaceae bacterium]|nr:sugar transferase [Microscillaceae bacterium]MDW8459747.1 sugar transferase [Cytophagales bacterium]